MNWDSVLTDEQLGLAVAGAVGADVAAAPQPDGLALLSSVRIGALVRRHRRRRTAAVSAGVLAVAVSVAWVLLGLGGYGVRSSGRTPPAHPSLSTQASKVERTRGALAPGQVVGTTPGQLSSEGPYAVIPPLPAGVSWGASAAQLRAAFDRNSADLVAFPFPASAVLQPADLGAAQVGVSGTSVQSTRLFPPLGAYSCTGGYDPGWTDVVAGLGISLWPTAPDEGVPGSAQPSTPEHTGDGVQETIAAFQGNGAHQLVEGAPALMRCIGAFTGSFANLEVLPRADLPGDEAFAALGGPVGGNPAQTWDFLGLARAGKVTVSVDLSSADSATARDDLMARGQRLLAAAVARVRTPEVQGLVARYVR